VIVVISNSLIFIQKKHRPSIFRTSTSNQAHVICTFFSLVRNLCDGNNKRLTHKNKIIFRLIIMIFDINILTTFFNLYTSYRRGNFSPHTPISQILGEFSNITLYSSLLSFFLKSTNYVWTLHSR